MSTFKRGITNQSFINELNLLRRNPNSFWSIAVSDPELFIAIRDEYLSIYYNGNSLLKIAYEQGQLRCYSHYKFLINQLFDQTYIGSDGINISVQQPQNLILKTLNIESMKKAIKVYSGTEKAGVHKISCIAPNVIDVEIAFNGVDDLTTKPTNDRIDFLRLIEINGHLKLVFFEAKHYSNTEICAKVPSNIKVFNQLDKYEKCIIKHHQEIISSYVTVCKNLVSLNLVGRRNLISKVANGDSINIDPDVRLVIFGYDRDQSQGPIFKGKMYNLKQKIGNHLIAKGNASSFKTFKP